MVNRRGGWVELSWKSSFVFAKYESRTLRLLQLLRVLRSARIGDREKLRHAIQTGQTLERLIARARRNIAADWMDDVDLIESLMTFWIRDVHSILDEVAAVVT